MDRVFLGRVGHDLRGELATMVAGLHYLLRYERDLSPTARQMLDRVNDAGQRLRRLLDEVDHAAWIDGGDASALRPELVSVSELVATALDRLERAISANGVEIERESPVELPRVTVDRDALSMALEYLLDFAVARSERSTVRLACAARDGAVTITIADSGPAVPESLVPSMFDQFVERELIPLPQTGGRRRERLGLGLAIANGVVGAHGGKLRAVTSEGGRGVSLCVTLPAADAAAKQRAG